MLKKVLLAAVALAVVGSIGLFFWARAIFTGENVRAALAGQLAAALGQPVTVGSVAATVYPRVTLNLSKVTIGNPARIRVDTLHVGTDFRALLSRRIEHAAIRLAGAQIELPLPPLTLGSMSSSASSASSSELPVEIVSVDEVVLRDVQVVSGGHSLRGDIEAVPQGKGATITRITLRADSSKIEGSGKISDFSGPMGELTLKAGTLNLDRLLAFGTGFSSGMSNGTSGSNQSANGPPAQQKASTTNIRLTLDAGAATLGVMTLNALAGRARIDARGITLDPLAFGLFGGRYDGGLSLNTGARAPAFQWRAALSNIDVNAATAYAGSPDTISGRLSGRIDLTGQGTDASTAIRSAKGTARVDIVDGVIRRLGLLRSVVVATSMRSDTNLSAVNASSDESFSRLGATLAIANGLAVTQDLRLEAKDLSLDASGSLALDGHAINLKGRVQLSDELSQQAGRDLVRYTQEGGRVTLPATVTGSAQNPQVQIDVADAAKRAITNRVNEEVQKALQRLFKR